MSTHKDKGWAVINPEIRGSGSLYKTYDPDTGLFGDAIFNTERAATLFARQTQKNNLPAKVCMVVYYIER